MRMRNLKMLAVLGACAVSTIGLTGCQSSCTGDPRFDNYWCASGNLSNGVYAAQTANLRQTAYSRQAEAAALRSRLEARRASLAAARANRASQAEIRLLEDDISSLRQQITALNR